jgi:hypothetical protein
MKKLGSPPGVRARKQQGKVETSTLFPRQWLGRNRNRPAPPSAPWVQKAEGETGRGLSPAVPGLAGNGPGHPYKSHRGEGPRAAGGVRGTFLLVQDLCGGQAWI